MKITKFNHLLDRFGADLSVWPAAEAFRARRLLLTSQQARDSLHMAEAIASAIRESRPAISDPIARQVALRASAAIARQRPAPFFSDWIRARLLDLLPHAALAASLACVGFLVGFVLGSPETEQSVDGANSAFVTASADDTLD